MSFLHGAGQAAGNAAGMYGQAFQTATNFYENGVNTNFDLLGDVLTLDGKGLLQDLGTGVNEQLDTLSHGLQHQVGHLKGIVDGDLEMLGGAPDNDAQNTSTDPLSS